MLKPIPIYRAEAQAGLAEAIASEANRTIASLCPLFVNKDAIASITNQHGFANFEALSANLGQFDLHYIYAILASTGWNDNDDVFDRYETWAARHTAEDKPFNHSHDPTKIIGHITSSCVVDDAYALIDNDLTVDDLPDSFHVLNSVVLYKHLSGRNKELTQATADLIKEIDDGQWFVSMECLFSNFDYALVTPEGKQLIVPRNESTAFLSKHLRVYKGTGEYQGSKVGRLMRNMVFSGEGLVKNPGNSKSVILQDKDSQVFKGLLAEANKIEFLHTKQGDDLMAENTEQVQALERQLSESNRLNSELNTRLKAMDEAKVNERFAALEAQIAAQKTELTEAGKKITTSEAALAEANKKIGTLETAKAEADKSLADAQGKLQQIEAEKVKTNRVSTLVDKGVDKAAAEAVVTKFANVNDEQFESIVETQAALVEARKAATASATQTQTPPAGKPEEGKGKEGKGAASAEAADREALAGAVEETSAALGTQAEGKVEEAVAGLSNWFSEVLNGADGEAQS